MAWSVSTSVCLLLLLVLCAEGTSVRTNLSDYCSEDSMNTVPNFDTNAFQGLWYLSRMTTDVGAVAHKMTITETVPLHYPETTQFFYIQSKMATDSYGAMQCLLVNSLNTINESSYLPNKWVYEESGSVKIRAVDYYVLATDYDTTMVLYTFPIYDNTYGIDYSWVSIFVRNWYDAPNVDVMYEALNTFCDGNLNDANDALYFTTSYFNAPWCFWV